ncbi:MAG: prolipoprotein diacylglyceryl transferase [Candidatus Omnitrophica bacterium]|nr:prolipoprotein diacylglyceryl transferase [Candidatus Omnitrophota bacterium]
MRPEICTIGPFTIYSYGIMLVAAFLVSVSLACRKATALNLNPDKVFNLAFLSFVAGIIGARLFYVIENFGYYVRNLLEIVKLQHGGLSWFGGLGLGLLVAFRYVSRSKLEIYSVLDLFAPFVALAQSIGRIGCLLNGCCYGKESIFGIYFPVHGKILIPTQIYSSLFLLALFIILRFLQEKNYRKGEIIFTYLLLYSAGRFLVEFWRADNPVLLWGLTLFQLISLALFSISLIKLIAIKTGS